MSKKTELEKFDNKGITTGFVLSMIGVILLPIIGLCLAKQSNKCSTGYESLRIATICISIIKIIGFALSVIVVASVINAI